MVYAADDPELLRFFLSRRRNHRDDEYGGPLANRARLLREVISDTRDAIGDTCAVVVRMTIDEMSGPDGILAGEEGRDIVALLAETLRLRGHQVTLVTPSPLVSAWTVNTLEQEKIQRRVLEAGIDVVANANLVAMRAGEVDLACVFTGRQHTRRADNVLMVTARLPNALLHDELAETDVLKSLVRIGDCMAPRTISYAVFTGRRAAEALDEPASDILSFRTEPVATEQPLRQPAPRLRAAE